ncbi:hypothetical protein Tco_0512562 [Tanacetum coccineum]
MIRRIQWKWIRRINQLNEYTVLDRELDTPYPMEVDTPHSAIDQNSLEVGSIRRIQGLDTAYWGFLGVRTTLDIFQNIHILYLEYGILSILESAAILEPFIYFVVFGDPIEIKMDDWEFKEETRLIRSEKERLEVRRNVESKKTIRSETTIRSEKIIEKERNRLEVKRPFEVRKEVYEK